MANRSPNQDPFLLSGRKELDLNLRTHGQIGQGKQAHPHLAEINTDSIHAGRIAENLYRGVKQLAFLATPVWLETALKNHPHTLEDKVAQRSSRAKVTEVQ
jgi:hypothetical protein